MCYFILAIFCMIYFSVLFKWNKFMGTEYLIKGSNVFNFILVVLVYLLYVYTYPRDITYPISIILCILIFIDRMKLTKFVRITNDFNTIWENSPNGDFKDIINDKKKFVLEYEKYIQNYKEHPASNVFFNISNYTIGLKHKPQYNEIYDRIQTTVTFCKKKILQYGRLPWLR